MRLLLSSRAATWCQWANSKPQHYTAPNRKCLESKQSFCNVQFIVCVHMHLSPCPVTALGEGCTHSHFTDEEATGSDK